MAHLRVFYFFQFILGILLKVFFNFDCVLHDCNNSSYNFCERCLCEHSDQYRISPRWSHELILCTILWFLESMIRQPAGFRRKRVCLPGDGRSLLTFSDSPLNEMCSSKLHRETPLTAITEPVRSCFLCAARAIWTVAHDHAI